MTGSYKAENYKVDHSIFGGEISIDDFDTVNPNKNRINNQVEAINLQKNIEEKNEEHNRMKKYQSMTLEELREMRIVSNTNGRPSDDLTDDKWQKEFAVRKLFVEPYPKTVKRFGGKFSKKSGTWNEEKNGTYLGTTNYQEYCAFINDVLKNIHSGQTDYCYFIYQIMDLVKFHFDTLKTQYCDGYWKVWLEV